MSRAVLEHLWRQSQRLFGDEHGLTRARFGRMVAASGGWLTLASAGPAAFVAWRRAMFDRGYSNRTLRRESQSLALQWHLLPI